MSFNIRLDDGLLLEWLGLREMEWDSSASCLESFGYA